MYTKLFAHITKSSIIQESVMTRWVFVALLAISDKNGLVMGTDFAISREINVSMEDFAASMAILMAPDPQSNNVSLEGRRIIRSEATHGYLIVNYRHYRDIKNKEDRAVYMKEYMADYRKIPVLDVNNHVNKTCKDVNPVSASASGSVVLDGKEVFRLWNAMGVPFPRCLKMTKPRSAHLAQRLADEWWVANLHIGLERIRDSKFCRGANDRGWIADMDFLLRPDSLVKVMEGKYDNKKSGEFRVNNCESPVRPGKSPSEEAIERLQNLKSEAKNSGLSKPMWKLAQQARQQAATAIPSDLQAWFESEERRQAQDAS